MIFRNYIFFLFLILFNVIQSQDVQEKSSNFGVKLGINSSSLSGESTKNDAVRESDVKSRIGFYVGGFYHHKINEKFSVQPELLFSYQGASIEITRWEGIPVTAGSDIDLPYIILPVLFQYKPIDKFTLEIGPQLGYNLGKFITIKGKIELNEETIDLEERLEDVARWDVSLLAGAGYEIFNNFAAKLRFAQGLNSLDQRKGDAFVLYNKVFSLGVEYKF